MKMTNEVKHFQQNSCLINIGVLCEESERTKESMKTLVSCESVGLLVLLGNVSSLCAVAFL